ncbi:MAG: rod shape-determining protein MreC [bacterium]|nr:rod shape-determining protein MreC [Candidatus Wildermuthbacteria bacterium]MDP2664833.1 rod shape-determining protein MreC [bacterium]
MQFSSLRSRAVLISLVLLLVVSLNLFSSNVRNFFYSLTSPVLSFFWEKGSGGESETELLRSQVHSLVQRLVSLEGTEEENEQLRKALDLEIPEKFEFLETHILARDPGEDSILVDIGKKQGVKIGMPVITPSSVLIGKVGEVLDDFSKVLLVSHPEVFFDGKVAGKDVSGLVKGNGRFGADFSLVSKEKSLEKGDVVVTTKLGLVFPENLLVGEVQSLSSNPADPFQSATLGLFSKQENLGLFFVITNMKR